MVDRRITTQLNSFDAEVRKQAIRKLAQSRDPDALRVLYEVYRRDLDTEVRELARKAGVHLKQRLGDAAIPAEPEVLTMQGEVSGEWGDGALRVGGLSPQALERVLIVLLCAAGVMLLFGFMQSWFSYFGDGYDGLSLAQRAGELDAELPGSAGPGMIALLLWAIPLAGIVQIVMALHLAITRSVMDQWYWVQALLLGMTAVVPLSWLFLKLADTIVESGLSLFEFVDFGYWLAVIACGVLIVAGYAGLVLKK